METLSKLLNEHEVAQITGLSVSTMRRRRLFNYPPRYCKIGAAVRYRQEDVAAWLNSEPTGGTTAREPK